MVVASRPQWESSIYLDQGDRSAEVHEGVCAVHRACLLEADQGSLVVLAVHPHHTLIYGCFVMHTLADTTVSSV